LNTDDHDDDDAGATIAPDLARPLAGTVAL
jgi:hypothetical protein